MTAPPPAADGPATWVFDVDGCLVDSLSGRSLRPGTVDLLTHLRRLGCQVLLWSAGGADYARERAVEQSIERYFDGFHGKDGRDDGGHYLVDALAADPSTCVFVDDRPEDLCDHLDVVAVSPYLAHTPHDKGLGPALLRAGIR